MALSDRVPVLQVLAALRAEAGDSQQAHEPLRRVAQLQPAQYNNLQRVMAAQAGAKKHDAAAKLRLAMEMVPTDLGVSRDLIVVHLVTGRPEEALMKGRSVQGTAPGNPAGWLLESQVHETVMRFDEAERSLRQGLKSMQRLACSPGACLRRWSRAASGRRPRSPSASGITEHAKDTVFQTQLGDRVEKFWVATSEPRVSLPFGEVVPADPSESLNWPAPV